MNARNQDITLATYEADAEEFVARTPNELNHDFKSYLDMFLSKIQRSDSILEIGSASGRDADYIEAKGFSVTRTDIVEAFIRYQRDLGREIEIYNAIDGDLGRKFDLIIATAVFLHFDGAQFDQALANTRKHLHKSGWFALALKYGEGEEFSDEKLNGERYFRYWKPEELSKVLQSQGFSVNNLRISDDGQWVFCVACLK